MAVTPWDVKGTIDYAKLIWEFGMQPFHELMERIPKPHKLMRRGVIFGHRDYWRIVEAINSNRSWAVMSGFMPSGNPHFGHKMTMDEIIWHQKMGAKTFVAIADIEAHVVRGMNWSKTLKLGFEYIKSLIALGLEKDSIIYFQSKNNDVKDLAIELSNEVNLSELKAIYGFTGETQLAKMFVTAIQASDILYPQLEKFNGPKPVVVPVGADQDPHLRLTRDLASRVNIYSLENIKGGLRIRSRRGTEYLDKLDCLGYEMKKFSEHVDIFGDKNEIEEKVRKIEIECGGFGFIPPSSIYHKFTTGLYGGKMSSSKPESFISLIENPKNASRKVMRAFTGGRATASEQRRYGGEPEKCVVFEMYTYHLIENDKELKEIYENCKSGKILCGQCKKLASELLEEFLKDHQEKREEAEDNLNEYEIIF